jgi:cation-transporting ATPase F
MDFSPNKLWHHLPSEECVDLLQVEPNQGLGPFQVEQRRATFGPNRITPRRGKTKLERFFLQFHQPLVYILLIAGVVTIGLGEFVDAAVIVGVVLVNAVVGYIQESKAVQALEALARSMVTEAVVLREGHIARIPAEDLVPGDIVILRSGDKVPADLRLLEVKDLRVDESALTGESVASGKIAGVLPRDTVLADRKNMAYASTLVTYGQATGVVVATGDHTEIGRISTMVAEADELATPLTRKIARFSHTLLWAIIALAALTFVAGLLRGQPAADTFLAAVALAVAAIPEGLPAAVTVILAMGVSRMAQRGAIIRKLPAVETLGGTTVICSDKTGTLTQNQMTVTRIAAAGQVFAVTGVGYRPQGAIEGFSPHNQALLLTLRGGLLCNDAQLTLTATEERITGDPTEAALIVSALKAGLDPSEEKRQLPRLDTLPFESEHQYMATLHDQGEGKPLRIFFKGSVEAALSRSMGAMAADGSVIPIDGEALRGLVDAMGLDGLRVLAVATKEVDSQTATITHDDVAQGLILTGLQAMMDPPRPEAIAAVVACKAAGVQVKMITGDHAVTAAAIGIQLGLGIEACPGRPSCQVLTGQDLANLSDSALAQRVAETAVFARVAPEQKLRLVMALQHLGEIVAMTGDGVNDAPALKQADIGIAMGKSGTEAAKEAADMVLTDDNFATIEAAVEEGRGVYDNLLKFIAWTLPTNVGEGLVILVAILLGVPLPILPVQILWINMTTAACLGLMLAFEPKEPGIMSRPPRRPDQPILDTEIILRIFIVAGILLVAAFGMYWWELAVYGDEAQARTVAVNVFVVVEAFYLFNSRSFTRSPFALGFFSNPWVIYGFAISIVLQLLLTYLPFMNKAFSTAPVGVLPWIKTIAVGIAAYFLVEWEKSLRNPNYQA